MPFKAMSMQYTLYYPLSQHLYFSVNRWGYLYACTSTSISLRRLTDQVSSIRSWSLSIKIYLSRSSSISLAFLRFSGTKMFLLLVALKGNIAESLHIWYVIFVISSRRTTSHFLKKYVHSSLENEKFGLPSRLRSMMGQEHKWKIMSSTTSFPCAPTFPNMVLCIEAFQRQIFHLNGLHQYLSLVSPH